MRPHALFFALFVAASMVAGEDERPVATFGEQIDLLEIEIDVLATDARGELVSDLSVEDLEILDRGEPVPIRAVAAPDDRPRRIALYIDHRRLMPHRRGRRMASMRELARRRLARGVQRLRFHCAFSSDPSIVEQALDEAASATRRVAALEIERVRLERYQRSEGLLGVEVDDFSSRYREDLRASVDALGEVSAVVAGFGAPATIVVVADALPDQPSLFGPARRGEPATVILEPNAASDPTAVSPRMQYVTVLPDLPDESEDRIVPHDLIARLNAARITIVPVVAAAHETPDSQAGSTILLRARTRIAVLEQLAAWTGGRPVTADRTLAERLDRELDGRHRVAFAAADPTLGHRPLHIRPLRKGLNARARRTLARRGPEQRLVDETLAALHLDLARNPLDVRAEQPIVRRLKGGLLDVELPISVPDAHLSAESGVTLCVVARDGNGERSEPEVIEVPHTRGAPFTRQLDLRIRADTTLIVLGVWSDTGAPSSLLHLSFGDRAVSTGS